jgi:hypothetical protein
MFKPHSHRRWQRIIDDLDQSRFAETPAFLARVRQCIAELRAGELPSDELRMKHGGIVYDRARNEMGAAK